MDISSPLRRAFRATVRLYTLYFPIHKMKMRLVYALRHWFSKPGERLVTRVGFDYWMDLDLRDHIQRSIYLFSFYEAPTAGYLRSRLGKGMVFADIGANVGQFTLLAARLVGPDGHVFAFEPEIHNYESLQRNIQLNHFSNIKALRMALADYEGTASLHVHHDSSNSNTGVHSLTPRPEWEHRDVNSVEVTTLDQALKDVPRLDLVKIDVEGAELLILRGARAHLIRRAEEPNVVAAG